MTSETPSLPNAWPGLMRPIATAHELILNRLNQMTRDPRYVSDVEELKLAQQTILDQERELNEARSLIHEADENKFAFVEWRQRAERAEAIAKGWAEAADRARQPDVFYKDYNEGTMRAMQVLLSKASVKLAECMAHAKAMASAPNQELLNVDREAFRTWRAKQ